MFEEAMVLEDALRYNEPADWHQPVRETYGAFLLDQKKFAEAEKIYREDLQLFRDNGWSLYGLHLSLKGQKKMKEADEALKKFNKAWAKGDVKLASSRY
jgi:tetratricopeptide (TPR) repeat protein